MTPLPSTGRRLPCRSADGPRADRGSVTVLALGYLGVLLAALGVVVSATSLHLARSRLQALADVSALAAAEALDPALYYVPDLDRPLVPLSDASVRREVTALLERAPGGSEVAIGSGTGTDDGATAQVELVRRVRLPFPDLPGLRGPSVTVRAVAAARAEALP